MSPPVRLPRPPIASSDPQTIAQLTELAFDLRSSWSHGADPLWEELDPEIWRETGDPWLVLRSAPRDQVEKLVAKPQVRELIEHLHQQRQRHNGEGRWFQAQPAAGELGAVAFFSMEFALAESLPLYSGGLGNVAGDYLKTASDLGVPLVGVGLLYSQGSFRQVLDADGSQREFFPLSHTSQMPIVPLRDESGEWVRVKLPRAGPRVWLRAWGARVGRVALYLLDSNDPSNLPADRGITAQLYGGGAEVRLLQEMAIGIGGWRLLRAMGMAPKVCHLNEGHAALAAVERARDWMSESGQPFTVALTATRAGNIFTTHTGVETGFDHFAPELVNAQLGAYITGELGISLDEFLALGRARPDDSREPLSMAWLAARASGAINGVSRRHGEVSRKIFQVLFPRWPESEVPVSHVTNGVHVPTWDSAAADAFWTASCGAERWTGEMTQVAKIVDCPDEALWALRAGTSAELVSFARERLVRQLEMAGILGEPLDEASRALDPDALTIGFARRFTAYKRPALLLQDAERLARLLTGTTRPVQIVVAGKAHPQDEQGKALVREWVRFARRPDVRRHAVYLADYDLRLAERLVQGVDLWINTPLPPWEACGTSGMKVLVNGGLNLSVLDGWWAEAYRPEVGWALPHDDASSERDAVRLYEILEQQVIPAFYERDPSGLPRGWLARMRASMATLTPMYSANRALREYVERYYRPAAQAFARRSASGGGGATSLFEWRRKVEEHFPSVHFGEVRVRTEGGRHWFSAAVYLGGLDAGEVAVQLYADAGRGHRGCHSIMQQDAPLIGAHGYVYRADVPDSRPAEHFTARVVPFHPEASVPLELPLVVWSR